MGSSLPRTRVFVIHFSSDAAPGVGRYEGRVEHVESGRSERFASSEAMNQFFARVLREEEGVTEQVTDGSVTKCPGANHNNNEGETE
jgi:hypothetical protein